MLLISIFLVYLSVYFVEFFHELIASVIFEIVVLNGCVWFGAEGVYKFWVKIWKFRVNGIYLIFLALMACT